MLLKLLVFEHLILSYHGLRYKNYCDITCETGKHTLCTDGYPEGGNENCKDWMAGNIEDHKEMLLQFHNERRQMLVSGEEDLPRGSNMMKMEWSDEASKIAQRWAEQCDKGTDHDQCRTLLTGEEAGQNIIIITFPATEVVKPSVRIKKSLAKSWYSSQRNTVAKDLVSSYAKSRSSADTYIQIIWANTTKLGCGLSKMEKGANYDYRVVCNYVPMGLTEGQPIYAEGVACSACPEGSKCSRSWPGLCTTDVADFENRGKGNASVIKMPIFTICMFLFLVIF